MTEHHKRAVEFDSVSVSLTQKPLVCLTQYLSQTHKCFLTLPDTPSLPAEITVWVCVCKRTQGYKCAHYTPSLSLSLWVICTAFVKILTVFSPWNVQWCVMMRHTCACEHSIFYNVKVHFKQKSDGNSTFTVVGDALHSVLMRNADQVYRVTPSWLTMPSNFITLLNYIFACTLRIFTVCLTTSKTWPHFLSSLLQFEHVRKFIPIIREETYW